MNPLIPQLGQGQNGTVHINAALADIATLNSFTVATLPAAALCAGSLVYVSNGAAGQPCLAYSNGTAWDRVLLGAAVSTTT